MYRFLQSCVQNPVKTSKMEIFRKILNDEKCGTCVPIFTIFISETILTRGLVSGITAQNTENSPNFLVWKLCGKGQFSQSFGRFARTSTETEPFHNISKP